MSKEKMKACQNLVEETLPKLLPEKDGYNDLLVDAMGYSLLSGGKRLRPILAMAACAAVGGKPEDALYAGCCIECIHAYSLIHDDLPGMDDDVLRRGKPTNHVVYGVGMATLAGDGLQALAFENLSRYWLQKEEMGIGLRVVRELAAGSGCDGMVVGQAQDLESEGRMISAEHMRYIHSRKTGALIKAAVRIGAVIGGADEEALAQITDYGTAIGLAFQITDDILDVVGDTAVIGKPVGSDEKNEKATYPALYGMEQARQMAADECARALQALEGLAGDTEILSYIANYILERKK